MSKIGTESKWVEVVGMCFAHAQSALTASLYTVIRGRQQLGDGLEWLVNDMEKV